MYLKQNVTALARVHALLSLWELAKTLVKVNKIINIVCWTQQKCSAHRKKELSIFDYFLHVHKHGPRYNDLQKQPHVMSFLQFARPGDDHLSRHVY